MILHDSPLRKRIEDFAAEQAQHRSAAQGGEVINALEMLPYGPRDEQGMVTCEVVGLLDAVEVEYASIRRAAGMFDATARGVIRITGGDAQDLLHRLLTQDVMALQPGMASRSFLINRQGRIQADLLMGRLDDAMLLLADVHDVPGVISTLEGFVFAEDVQFTDGRDILHVIELHGRKALEVLEAAGVADAASMVDLSCARATIAGVEVTVIRQDLVGEAGISVLVSKDSAEAVFDALGETDSIVSDGRKRVRPIGWYALNIARIEAGTPQFHVDYGETNIPNETSLLDDRVSFTKGCYPGQEIVARIKSHGEPKQMLYGLSLIDDALPMAGATVHVIADDDRPGDAIGTVTSSTLSPMHSSLPIALASLRSKAVEVGGQVVVDAEGKAAKATVCDLAAWRAAE
jgi:folate-binding protein YgfZ